MLSDNIIIKCVNHDETWIGWMIMHWFDNWHGRGSNLGEPKLNFFFPKFPLAWRWKGKETLAAKGAGKPS